MIASIVTWAVERRWLVLLLTSVAAVVGAISVSRLPIDAVPDITNNQVQVNVRAPALSPELIEKQVAYPIETALAGIKGLESTRSLSRNGFAQVTAIFYPPAAEPGVTHWITPCCFWNIGNLAICFPPVQYRIGLVVGIAHAFQLRTGIVEYFIIV